jgi:hypothetical protein
VAGFVVRILLLLCAALGLTAVPEAAARVVQITDIGGAVELGTEITHQTTKAPNTDKRVLDRYRFDEELELGASGYFLTREFITFRLGGSVEFRQEILDATGGSGTTFNTIPSYDAQLTFFPTKPISLTAFANRYEDRMVQSFGIDTEMLTEGYGGTLRLGNRWFPSVISGEWLHARSTSDQVGAFDSRREETRLLLEYSGQHLSDAMQAQLNVRAERVDDDSIPAVGDYDLYEADGSIGYRWGPYFERYWRTSASHFRRRGSFDFDSTNATSAFYWDPSETLQTRVEYDFNRFAADEQTSLSHTGVLAVNHQLYESLRTNLNLLFDRLDQEFGNRTAYSSNVFMNYQKKLPGDTRLLIDLGGRYRFENRDFEEDTPLTTQESLVLTSLVGNFLSNANVVESSIQVFESLGGPPLIPDVDYVVESFGERTSIDIGPSGVLEVNDVVIVTYEFLPDPSGKIARRGFRTGIGWDAGWFRVGYEHEQDKDRRVSGGDFPLQDTKRDSIRLDVDGEWRRVNAHAGLFLARERSRTLDFNEIAFGQEAVWTPLAGLTFAANLRETFRRFLDPDRDQFTLTVGASSFWRPRPDFSLRFFLDYRNVQNTDSPDQQDAGLGMTSKIRLGLIDVTPSLLWFRRERGESVTSDLRFVLRLRRDF